MRYAVLFLSFFCAGLYAQEQIDVKSLLSDENGIIINKQSNVDNHSHFSGLQLTPPPFYADPVRYGKSMDLFQYNLVPFRSGLRNFTEYRSNRLTQINHIRYFNYSVIKLSDRLAIEGGSFGKDYLFPNLNPDNLRGIDFNISYTLTDRLTLELSGYTILNNLQPGSSIETLSRPAGVNPGISFKLTDNLKIGGGVKYDFDLNKGKWATTYSTDMKYIFQKR